MRPERSSVLSHRLGHHVGPAPALRFNAEDISHEIEPAELLVDGRCFVRRIDAPGPAVRDVAHGHPRTVGELRIHMYLAAERHDTCLAEYSAVEDHRARGDERAWSDGTAREVGMRSHQHLLGQGERESPGRAKD